MDKLVTSSWRPLGKIWIPAVAGTAAVLGSFVATGELDREQIGVLIGLYFAAFFGYAIPQPGVEVLDGEPIDSELTD